MRSGYHLCMAIIRNGPIICTESWSMWGRIHVCDGEGPVQPLEAENDFEYLPPPGAA